MNPTLLALALAACLLALPVAADAAPHVETVSPIHLMSCVSHLQSFPFFAIDPQECIPT